MKTPRPLEANMNDHDRIQGTWRLTAGERGGQPFLAEILDNAVLIFKGDAMTTRIKGRDSTFSFALFPDRTPCGIDLNMNGTIGEGIYRLDGDTLTIVHTEAGRERPSTFATEAGTPLTMLVLKRETR